MLDVIYSTEDFLMSRLILCSIDCMGVFSQSLISWIIQKGNDLLFAVDSIEDDLNYTPLSSSLMVQKELFSQFQSAEALKMAVIFPFQGSKFPPL
jgi:hypothetical protein